MDMDAGHVCSMTQTERIWSDVQNGTIDREVGNFSAGLTQVAAGVDGRLLEGYKRKRPLQ